MAFVVKGHRKPELAVGSSGAEPIVPKVDSPYSEVIRSYDAEAKNPSLQPLPPGSLLEQLAAMERQSIETTATQAIDQLKRRHAEIRELTSALDQRIKRFELWVSTLPGRVETSLSMLSPNGDSDYKLILCLTRSGKNWTVEYYLRHISNHDEPDFRPLLEAGLQIKLHALPKLPLLIESMAVTQESVVKAIALANSAFDAFAARMGMPPVEGA